jgi:S-adenosylmethionine:tRNA ribosyltransferase-isomerase
MSALPTPLTRFANPQNVTAPAPAEYRGVARDGVRLLVATDQGISHAFFRDLPAYLSPGDLLVVNNSATLAAELDGRLDGRLAGRGRVVVHVATPLGDGTWVVELRTAPDGARPVLDAQPGSRVLLAGGARLVLVSSYPREGSGPGGRGNRLWRATSEGRPLPQLMLREGRPIVYGYLDRRYPLSAYQTVFASRAGSAEMPSAGRPFTPELVTRLIAAGVVVSTVTLHAGVSSQEAGEAPLPERFEVPEATADAVNAARRRGSRVVAVGTTVTRALESAVMPDGRVRPAAGWTERVVSPAEPPRVVDGLVTGWHSPDASHLLLVEAVAGAELTQRAYNAAVERGYLWHEFGDSALLLPLGPR